MKITEPRINDYIMKIMPDRDDVLKEMETYAARHDFPIIGPMVGRFLRQLVIITGAKRILELGSGYGYSAYWFAGGMSNGGKIICTDRSEDNARRGLEYMKRGGFAGRVEYQIGDAIEAAKKQSGQFDIILIDIDKKEYPLAFDLAIPLLKRGGILVTDNVLWSGRILHRKVAPVGQAVLEFNRRLFTSKEIFSAIIPIRDGLGIAIKM